MSSVTGEIAGEIAGVRTNFALSAVQSIGLGGGSIIRHSTDGSVRIGPDSVGFRLHEKAGVFGGDILTATDVAVASAFQSSGSSVKILQIGDVSRLAGLAGDVVQGAKVSMKDLIEDLIDGTKMGHRRAHCWRRSYYREHSRTTGRRQKL